MSHGYGEAVFPQRVERINSAGKECAYAWFAQRIATEVRLRLDLDGSATATVLIVPIPIIEVGHHRRQIIHEPRTDLTIDGDAPFAVMQGRGCAGNEECIAVRCVEQSGFTACPEKHLHVRAFTVFPYDRCGQRVNIAFADGM